MRPRRHLTHLDPDYPSRLRGLAFAPASLAVCGGPLEANRTVAVVGSRCAVPAATAFTGELCRSLVRAGAVIVSGGAKGIDSAAHRAALDEGGVTWLIAPTAPEHCPLPQMPLFDAVGASSGAIVWTSEDVAVYPSAFLRRNRILVALSDAVAVIQAGKPSGALHAAQWARKLGKPLWVVPELPWTAPFEGCRQLLDQGAAPLVSTEPILNSLVEPPSTPRPLRRNLNMRPEKAPERAPIDADPDPFSPDELAVWAVVHDAPLHVDSIAAHARRSAQATAAALLTLALKNVVVEDPPGFFCRRDP